MNPVIEVDNVSRSYKKVLALDDISFKVKRGQIFGLIGPDGAGKSTLTYIITGVLSAKIGKVLVLEKRRSAKPRKHQDLHWFFAPGVGPCACAGVEC